MAADFSSVYSAFGLEVVLSFFNLRHRKLFLFFPSSVRVTQSWRNPQKQLCCWVCVVSAVLSFISGLAVLTRELSLWTAFVTVGSPLHNTGCVTNIGENGQAYIRMLVSLMRLCRLKQLHRFLYLLAAFESFTDEKPDGWQTQRSHVVGIQLCGICMYLWGLEPLFCAADLLRLRQTCGQAVHALRRGTASRAPHHKGTYGTVILFTVWLNCNVLLMF